MRIAFVYWPYQPCFDKITMAEKKILDSSKLYAIYGDKYIGYT